MSRSQKQTSWAPDGLTFVQESLGQALASVREVIQPSLYRRFLRQVGERIGRDTLHRHQGDRRPGPPCSVKDYVQLVERLAEQVGWNGVVQEVTDEAVSFTVPVCPFGQQPHVDSSICLIETGMLGCVAATLFGQSKVTVQRGEGPAPRNCRITVHLRTTQASRMAEGVVYPVDGTRRNGRMLPPELDARLAELSRREREIFRLLGEGLSNKDVADALHLSVRTVEGHINRLRGKLQVRGRANLAFLAFQHRLHSS